MNPLEVRLGVRIRPYILLRRSIIVIALFAGLLSGCRRSERVQLDHPQIVAGVAMQDVTFHSGALKREMPYRVFLPAQIPAGQKLPVVYLLHGNGGGFRNWSDYSDVSKYAAQGLILIMPDGNSSYFMNAVEKPRDKYEDYLMQDLIGDVEGRFPAKPGRANRAVVGVSMGGFAAVTLALRHPDMFFFAGAISPAIDVPERRFTWKRASRWWEFRSIFGPLGSAERDARDPFVLLRSAKPASTPYVYLTAGEQESLREPIERFAAHLQARGVAYEFHTKPGGHDWAEWDAQIPGCFAKLLTVPGKAYTRF
jgi:S-formylglutathione hydrolase FrmB